MYQKVLKIKNRIYFYNLKYTIKRLLIGNSASNRFIISEWLRYFQLGLMIFYEVSHLCPCYNVKIGFIVLIINIITFIFSIQKDGLSKPDFFHIKLNYYLNKTQFSKIVPK